MNLGPARQCPECQKWFYFTEEKCPDEEDHVVLKVKCCHWGDIEAGPPKSSQERKRRKKLR